MDNRQCTSLVNDIQMAGKKDWWVFFRKTTDITMIFEGSVFTLRTVKASWFHWNRAPLSTTLGLLELTCCCNNGHQSIQFSCSVMSASLRPHLPQHDRLSCPTPTSRACSNPCPLSGWCHPTISSSVVPFSFCPQSLPASKSFPTNQLFAWGCQSTGVSASASVLLMNIEDWFPLGWTGWISLQSKGLSRVFSNTTIQKHQFISLLLKASTH